jgi:hypothetical protein
VEESARVASKPRTQQEQERKREEVRRALEGTIHSLDGSLRQEPFDRAWSAQIRTALDTILAAPELQGSSIKDFECRSTLCRIEVAYADQAAMDGFRIRFSTMVPGIASGTVLQKENVDGKPTTVGIYARAKSDVR